MPALLEGGFRQTNVVTYSPPTLGMGLGSLSHMRKLGILPAPSKFTPFWKASHSGLIVSHPNSLLGPRPICSRASVWEWECNFELYFTWSRLCTRVFFQLHWLHLQQGVFPLRVWLGHSASSLMGNWLVSPLWGKGTVTLRPFCTALVCPLLGIWQQQPCISTGDDSSVPPYSPLGYTLQNGEISFAPMNERKNFTVTLLGLSTPWTPMAL